MKWSIALVGLLSNSLLSVKAAPVAEAQQAAPTQTASPSASTNPCAVLSASWVAETDSIPKLKPSQVLACLKNVPINIKQAAGFVNYLSTIIQFQSTLSYLKSPPSGYVYPPVDLVGGLDTILNNVNSNGYSNEYDFEVDIHNLMTNARDGHLFIVPVLVGAFVIMREPLVSISDNGINLPKVFFRSDINSTGGYTPSELVKVDGQDVNTYLAAFPYGYQDKDASYNSNFFNPATWIAWQDGTFAESLFGNYSDTSTYTFANGSSTTLPNNAVARIKLSGITSGADIYDDYVFAEQTQSSGKVRRTESRVVKRTSKRDVLDLIQERAVPSAISSLSFSETLPTASSTTTVGPAAETASTLSSFGFPTPVAVSIDNSVAGYFLDSESDTAVLNIAQFTDESDGTPLSFQKTITKFLAACSAQGKKKLIIDVRGNPGGITMTAFDAFKQIFPSQSISTRIRVRDHPVMNAMGTVLSQFGDPVSSQNYMELQENPTTAESALLYAKNSVFNVANNLKTPDGQAYDNWQDFYGPVTFNGDSFSNYYSLDFEAEGYDLFSGGGIVVSGYATNTSLPPQVFDPKNVTLVTDGQCSSSCGLFSNLIIRQGNVSTLSFGGQPSTNPMNTIGGTQGAQVMPITKLVQVSEVVTTLVMEYGFTISDTLAQSLAAMFDVPSINLWKGDGTVNFLDNTVSGSDVPLQFQTKASNCRAFYTADDINNISKTWAKISAGNITCVDGGTKPGAPKKNGATKYGSLELGWAIVFAVLVSAMMI